MSKQRKIDFYVAGVIVLLITLILLTTGCSSATKVVPTPTPDPVGQVKAFEDAYNRHDVDGALAMFAENAWYFQYFPNQQIRDYFAYSKAMSAESHFSDCAPAQDTVTCKSSTYSDTCTKLAGVRGMPDKNIVFTFKDGKISKVSSASEESAEAYNVYNFYGAIIYWAVNNDKTAELDKTGPAGSDYRFTIYNSEAGEATARLCQEYADSEK